MKKLILLLVVVAIVALPAVAMAVEFSLGGFIKLDAFWDSTQAGKNLNQPILRNNDPNFHNGRMKFTAQGSRFNFTIKGPDVFGAKTTGFMEVDFDSNENQNLGTGFSASNSWTPRLRHAMFRFNWPETELLLGQYWSMFCEFYPESVQDGPLQGHGMPTARLAQIRLTQKFLGAWEVAGMIANPTNTNNPYDAALGWPIVAGSGQSGTGEAAETPQLQGKVQYSQDLWGKAAYYGKPMPFTARVIGGWQRNNMRNNAGVPLGFTTFGQNNPTVAIQTDVGNHQYVDPWMIMGNLFIPVIPTTSANLSGTASLSVQGYVGQGVGVFGENMGGDTYLKFEGRAPWGTRIASFELFKKYGGYVSGQYYFTNQWFANVTAGLGKYFGVAGASGNSIANVGGFASVNPQGGTAFGAAGQPKSWMEIDATLWYRPVQAIKFGLQYAYSRTDWYQVISNAPFVGRDTSSMGDGHRVEFVGFFYF